MSLPQNNGTVTQYAEQNAATDLHTVKMLVAKISSSPLLKIEKAFQMNKDQ